MNRTHFQAHLMLIGTATNKELTPGLSDLWWRKFGALPDDVLNAAFEVVIDTCKFFPAPAEFNDILRQVAAQSGAVVNGDTAWEECQRTIFSRYSEANDAIIRREGKGYPWPNDRCKVIVREKLNQTVRGIAMLNDYERAKLRERFIKLYDETQAVERAEVAIDAPNVRRLQAGD